MVVGAPTSGGELFIYLQRHDLNGQFLWNAPVEDWHTAVTPDDGRWIPYRAQLVVVD
jgi:hypothetical protein